MRYFGGKQRISKQLSQYLNSQLKDSQPFVDLFCGSCNIISKIDKDRVRIANDKHKYLISMWKELQNGWQMPNNISEEEYKYIKDHKDENPALTGFVGFGLSYSGKWFGGYCRGAKGRNYCLNAKNSNNKILKNIMDVKFYNLNYDEVPIPDGSLVYCDIPYKNTTKYATLDFPYEEFYSWCRKMSKNNVVLISEYDMPNDYFECIWEKKVTTTLNNHRGVNNEKNNRTEKLFICK